MVGKSESSNTKSHIISLMLIAALTVILAVRVLFGFDWSDEGYYSAITYRLLLREPMFLTSWDIHQFAAPLTFPLMKLYTEINGGIDGWILFYRLSFVVLKIASIYAFIRALGKSVNEVIAFSAAALLALSDTVYSLNYNSMMIFITFAIVMLISLKDNNEHCYIGCLLCGVSYAIAVQAYPAALITAPVFLLWIASDSKKNSRSILKCELMFALGGLSIIVAFLAFVEYNSSLTDMFSNLHYMFMDLEHKDDTFSFSQYLADIRAYGWFKWFLLMMAAGATSHFIKYDKKRKSIQIIILVVSCLIIIIMCRPYVTPFQNLVPDYMVFLCIAALFPLMIVMKPQMHFTVWVFIIGALLSIGIDYASNNTVSFTTYPYVLSAGAAIVCIAYAGRIVINEESWLKYAVYIGLIMCVAILSASHMSYIYRPEVYDGKTLAMLNKRLESGPAKGL